MLLTYIYQLPYFSDLFKCQIITPNNPIPGDVCNWFYFFGINRINDVKLNTNIFLIERFYNHLIILILCLFEKLCYFWKQSLKNENNYKKSIIFDEEITEEQANIDFKFSNIKNQMIFYFNHFFEIYGFEVSLLFLLVGSILLIRTIWGLIYLILFSITLLIGKGRINYYIWVVIVFGCELNILILFKFR
jgi:hypothetical protein